MRNEHREDAPDPDLLPFLPVSHSIESTDEFEIDVASAGYTQTVDVRFFPRGHAKEAQARRNEARVILPTGGVLLVSIRPASPDLVARSLPG